VGRRDEIERINHVLDAVRAGGPGQVVELVGEAGIGKSTVVATVAAVAREQGYRVWSAAPTEAEANFPWTGLAQLLSDVRRTDLETLVDAHVGQLQSATSASRTNPVGPELVAFGLAALFDTARADSAPVLLAIDDVHWLDQPTAGAVAYALRGTPRRRFVALLSSRTGEPVPFEPRRLVEAEHYTRLELTGLSVASLREIIADATGHAFGRAELAQLEQRTGGNPLYATELARAVLDGVPLEAAALPESLRATIGRRINALPTDTRRVLGAAALAVHPTVQLLMDALSDIDVVGALAPAETEGVVHVRRRGPTASLIEFRHPLLAAAAIDTLTTGERRSVHAALASSVEDPVERAGHLIADLRVDAARAQQLEDAAREASSRGAVDAACDIAGASVEASPPGDDRATLLERRLLHAELALNAGRFAEMSAQIAHLRSALPESPSTDGSADEWRDLLERTTVLQTVAIVGTRGMGAAAEHAERALDVVLDPHRRYRLQSLLVRTTQHHDVSRAAAVAERAFGAGTEHTGWIAVLGSAQLANARVAAGDPIDLDEVVARSESAGLTDDEREQFLSQLVEAFVWTDHPRARELAEISLSRYHRLGNRTVYLSDLMTLSQHDFVRGDWARAEAAMVRIQEFAAEFLDIRQAHGDLAMLRAGQGHADAALRLLDAAVTAPEPRLVAPTERLWVACATGIVAHTLGLPDAADKLLASERLAIELGVHAVRGLHVRRDLVEALVAAGRLDDAEQAAARLAADAARNQVPTASADADAAAAVVAASAGDFATAQARFAASVAVQREYDLKYELARTLLAAGSSARRAGARTEARQHLEAAHALFDEMGAATWSRRAADELRRVVGRRGPAESDQLTPTEHQVAELVVAGKTNAEIAAALFVSVRTVESNLTRTYRKLGIRSRTELARHPAAQPS
jgi:predicted ATPase/DNA-binding CsgD family transcriptional regulator